MTPWVNVNKILCWLLDGSPGLVVMGRDSRSKGRRFESQHSILDGHFFTNICCKNWNVCLKRPKINKKEVRSGPLKNQKKGTHLLRKGKHQSTGLGFGTQDSVAFAYIIIIDRFTCLVEYKINQRGDHLYSYTSPHKVSEFFLVLTLCHFLTWQVSSRVWISLSKCLKCTYQWSYLSMVRSPVTANV